MFWTYRNVKLLLVYVFKKILEITLDVYTYIRSSIVMRRYDKNCPKVM